MLVSIGSLSVPKISAVCRAFSRFPELWKDDGKLEFVTLKKENRGQAKNAEIDKVSGVSCNPMSLEECFTGAKNRAEAAYKESVEAYGKCDYSVGIESGLFKEDMVNTKFLETSAVVIFDGKNFYYGTSPSFELPKVAVEGALQGIEAGFMDDVFGPGTKGRRGIIGALTDERIYRDDFEELGVICALTQVLKKDIYEK